MNTVENEVIQLLCSKFHCTKKELENGTDMSLTGRPFYLSDIEMVYLLLEVEKKYQLHIDEKFLVDYGFSTVHQIAEAVDWYMKDGKAVSG